MLLYYVLAFDPGVSPFANKRGSYPSPSSSTNPVDAIIFQVFRILRSRLGLKPERHLQLESTFNRVNHRRHRNRAVPVLITAQCIPMLADTQLITGIAIMISGYYSLTCGLSAYHRQTVLFCVVFMSHPSFRPDLSSCPSGVAGVFIPLQTSLYFALRMLLDLYASMLSEARRPFFYEPPGFLIKLGFIACAFC